MWYGKTEKVIIKTLHEKNYEKHLYVAHCGGLGRSKSFESLFFCPEAIKSKQMPMCQKAKKNC